MTDHDDLLAALQHSIASAKQARDEAAEHPAPEPPSDEAAMHIDPEPPGVTTRPFTDAEVAALDAEPPSGGEVTADELAEVIDRDLCRQECGEREWDRLPGHRPMHTEGASVAAAILAWCGGRRKP